MDFFSSGLAGWGVRDPNFRLRFFVIMFMGVIAFGAVMFWRSRLLLSKEYVDVPMASHLHKNKLYQDLDK